MLKLKKTYASIVLFAQIILLLELNEVPLHEYVPLVCHWLITILMGPLEYILVYQQDWAPHLTPFVYGMTTLGIYATYTWIIEDWAGSWSLPIYTTHIGWIVLRILTPEENLVMDFSALVSKLF